MKQDKLGNCSLSNLIKLTKCSLLGFLSFGLEKAVLSRILEFVLYVKSGTNMAARRRIAIHLHV